MVALIKLPMFNKGQRGAFKKVCFLRPVFLEKQKKIFFIKTNKTIVYFMFCFLFLLIK